MVSGTVVLDLAVSFDDAVIVVAQVTGTGP